MRRETGQSVCSHHRAAYLVVDVFYHSNCSSSWKRKKFLPNLLDSLHLKPDLESLRGDTRLPSPVIWPALRDNQLEEGKIPEFIEVKFDDLYEKIKIYPITVEFDGNRGYGKIQRRMLPLILCWAVTVHKLQGVRLEKGVIYFGKKNFAKGQTYVALIRVKSVEGLCVTDLHMDKLLISPHDTKSLSELERIRS